jgi:hypothetical protein
MDGKTRKAMSYKVKITRKSSNHNSFRTDSIDGIAEQLPAIGSSFRMLGESLSFKGGVRVVVTTPVKEITRLRLTKPEVMEFKTANSVYEVEYSEIT